MVVRHRTRRDRADDLSGRAPSAADEVAIDELFAGHTGLGVGDTVTLVRPTLASTAVRQPPEPAGTSSGWPTPQLDEPDDEPVRPISRSPGAPCCRSSAHQTSPRRRSRWAGWRRSSSPMTAELQAALDWLPSDLPPVLQADVDDRLANLEIEDRVAYIRFSGDPRQRPTTSPASRGSTEIVAPTDEQVLTLLVGLNLSANRPRTDRPAQRARLGGGDPAGRAADRVGASSSPRAGDHADARPVRPVGCDGRSSPTPR